MCIRDSLLCCIHAQPPKQGVFLLANTPANQVLVWESLPSGELAWHRAYNTNGSGHTSDDPIGLRSSNAVHYHVWGGTGSVMLAEQAARGQCSRQDSCAGVSSEGVAESQLCVEQGQ
eukprot:TRINITY_DN9207_c0_g1_i1.p2 TRINITY_DN9207_c0_g1~~TRINITY_DN9207_c0_g1_i1.p2  ORF type:complete len:117 (-),score=37.19 TRINITY_DN9207_c0_g1_i1:242-592(-)